VDLVVTLKSWNEVADMDLLGMEQQHVQPASTFHIAISFGPAAICPSY
jgi:hypothetical protein